MSADVEAQVDGLDVSVGSADDDGPPPSVRRIAYAVRLRSTTLRCTLAAVGAWAITVAPLVFIGRSSGLTRLVALISILPGIAGPQLIARSQKVARHVGVTVFLAAVLVGWGLASNDQTLATVDIFRAVLGAIAWTVFGLAWSHPWSVPDVDLARAPEGETMGLKPRRMPPGYAVGVAAIGAACALLCLGLGWLIDDSHRAVFAQAISVASAIALLTSASTIAVIAGKERSSRRRSALPVNRKVVTTLVLTAVAMAVAVALYMIRS